MQYLKLYHGFIAKPHNVLTSSISENQWKWSEKLLMKITTNKSRSDLLHWRNDLSRNKSSHHSSQSVFTTNKKKIPLLFNCDLDFNLRIGEQAPVHLYVCANRLFFRSIPTPLGKTRPLWPGLEIFANINLNGSARGNHVFPQEFLESNKREFGRLKWRVWQGGSTFTR